MASGQYTFTCLNLWLGGKMFEPIVDFLCDQDADIVALQEAFEEPDENAATSLPTLAKLNEKLRYPYQDFAATMINTFPEGNILEGNATLTKYPIKASDVSFFYGEFGDRNPNDPSTFPTTPRNVEHVAIEILDGVVNLFNFQGVWDLNGDNDSPQRREMVEHILDVTKGLQHVIIAGDTNARPTNPAMKPLNQRFVNIFDGQLSTTFNMKRKSDPGYATSVVDMIFVSRDIKVIDNTCHKVDVSDHLALSMTFELT